MGKPLAVPYEAPQGRRVNALGAYFSHGPLAGRFVHETYVTLPKSQAKTRRKTPQQIAQAHGLSADETGPIDSGRFVTFMWRVAGRPQNAPEDWKRERPLWIVLDNYSVHTSQPVQQASAALLAADVHLFYLPPYSPELSLIEPVWNTTKHHDLPQRSHAHVRDLKQAVDTGLQAKARALEQAHTESANLLCTTT